MGTRAAFFVGNPCDLENREFIGAFHWDGYPHAIFDDIGGHTDEASFREALTKHVDTRDDWSPADSGFPYPWKDDLFLTDYVYAFFDGALRFTGGYTPWMEISERGLEDEEAYYEAHENEHEKLPEFENVAAPGEWNGSMGGTIVIAAAQ